MEMSIHNSVIFQLERELIRHQSEVSELMVMAFKWIDIWSEKRRKLKRAEEGEPRFVHGSERAEQDKAPTNRVPSREVAEAEEGDGRRCRSIKNSLQEGIRYRLSSVPVDLGQ